VTVYLNTETGEIFEGRRKPKGSWARVLTKRQAKYYLFFVFKREDGEYRWVAVGKDSSAPYVGWFRENERKATYEEALEFKKFYEALSFLVHKAEERIQLYEELRKGNVDLLVSALRKRIRYQAKKYGVGKVKWVIRKVMGALNSLKTVRDADEACRKLLEDEEILRLVLFSG